MKNCEDSPNRKHEFAVDEEAGDGRINCCHCGMTPEQADAAPTRYEIVVCFDLKKDAEPLTEDQERTLLMWVQGTLDNGEYSEDVGFAADQLTMGYVGNELTGNYVS